MPVYVCAIGDNSQRAISGNNIMKLLNGHAWLDYFVLFHSSMKNANKLSKQFKKDIIDPMGSKTSSPQAGSSVSKSKERSKPYDDDPLRERPRHPQRGPPPEWFVIDIINSHT